MNLTSTLTLCQGLAFFLYGMMILSAALRCIAGGSLERTLKQLTSGRVKGLLLGTGITVLLQSSSALTVMLVSLVDSGIMELRQTIGVIMGSNIGTTLTTWLFALTDLDSNSPILSLFKLQHLSPLLALTGVLLAATAKRPQRRSIGHMLAGFSILIYGMELMTQAVSPWAETAVFSRWVSACRNPVVGLLTGAVFTAVIQSSAASIGILQALTLSQSISYSLAIPIIMGQNIGTCITALLSSLGASRRAKQVAAIHISFNLIGSLCGLFILSAATRFLHIPLLAAPSSPAGIALCHTLFNLGTTLLLLPFPAQLEFLANRLVPTPAPADGCSRRSPTLF